MHSRYKILFQTLDPIACSQSCASCPRIAAPPSARYGPSLHLCLCNLRLNNSWQALINCSHSPPAPSSITLGETLLGEKQRAQRENTRDREIMPLISPPLPLPPRILII